MNSPSAPRPHSRPSSHHRHQHRRKSASATREHISAIVVPTASGGVDDDHDESLANGVADGLVLAIAKYLVSHSTKVTQENIKRLSSYILHKKLEHGRVVSGWLLAFKICAPNQQVALFYAVNEVLQTCKRKDAEVYKNCFPKAIQLALCIIRDYGCFSSLMRLFNIWSERGTLSADIIASMRLTLQNAVERAKRHFNERGASYDFAALQASVEEHHKLVAHCRVAENEMDCDLYCRAECDAEQLIDMIKDRATGERDVLPHCTAAVDKCQNALRAYDAQLHKSIHCLDTFDDAVVHEVMRTYECKIVTNAFADYYERLKDVQEIVEKHLEALKPSSTLLRAAGRDAAAKAVTDSLSTKVDRIAEQVKQDSLLARFQNATGDLLSQMTNNSSANINPGSGADIETIEMDIADDSTTLADTAASKQQQMLVRPSLVANQPDFSNLAVHSNLMMLQSPSNNKFAAIHAALGSVSSMLTTPSSSNMTVNNNNSGAFLVGPSSQENIQAQQFFPPSGMARLSQSLPKSTAAQYVETRFANEARAAARMQHQQMPQLPQFVGLHGMSAAAGGGNNSASHAMRRPLLFSPPTTTAQAPVQVRGGFLPSPQQMHMNNNNSFGGFRQPPLMQMMQRPGIVSNNMPFLAGQQQGFAPPGRANLFNNIGIPHNINNNNNNNVHGAPQFSSQTRQPVFRHLQPIPLTNHVLNAEMIKNDQQFLVGGGGGNNYNSENTATKSIENTSAADNNNNQPSNAVSSSTPAITTNLPISSMTDAVSTGAAVIADSSKFSDNNRPLQDPRSLRIPASTPNLPVLSNTIIGLTPVSATLSMQLPLLSPPPSSSNHRRPSDVTIEHNSSAKAGDYDGSRRRSNSDKLMDDVDAEEIKRFLYGRDGNKSSKSHHHISSSSYDDHHDRKRQRTKSPSSRSSLREHHYSESEDRKNGRNRSSRERTKKSPPTDRGSDNIRCNERTATTTTTPVLHKKSENRMQTDHVHSAVDGKIYTATDDSTVSRKTTTEHHHRSRRSGGGHDNGDKNFKTKEIGDVDKNYVKKYADTTTAINRYAPAKADSKREELLLDYKNSTVKIASTVVIPPPPPSLPYNINRRLSDVKIPDANNNSSTELRVMSKAVLVGGENAASAVARRSKKDTNADDGRSKEHRQRNNVLSDDRPSPVSAKKSGSGGVSVPVDKKNNNRHHETHRDSGERRRRDVGSEFEALNARTERPSGDSYHRRSSTTSGSNTSSSHGKKSVLASAVVVCGSKGNSSSERSAVKPHRK